MADSGTVIGEKIRISGQVSGEEDLTVYGWVEGTINLGQALHVEPSGIVKADVQVDTAVISGVVVGNVQAATAVELLEGGRMVGNIMAPRVIIADGAAFRGYVDMGDVDAPEAAAKTTARASRPVRAQRSRPARTTKRAAKSAEAAQPSATTEPAEEAEVVVAVAKAPAKAKAKRKSSKKTASETAAAES